MSTLLVLGLSFAALVAAYKIYGQILSRVVFRLRDDEPMPSVVQRDNIDFVATPRWVLFGHHFTSIAGTGPIVGPAIAVMWGWLPALLWVVFGAILIGGVHDFAALVVSVRNRGKSIGDVVGEVISPAARIVFLLLLAFLLALIVAVFANVIATIFSLYPKSVLAVWASLPVAMVLGMAVHRFRVSLTLASIFGLVALYAAVVAGAILPPMTMPKFDAPLVSPVMLWTGVLLVYCFAASVLPVWLLLQPRDYINSQQLYIAVALIIVGIVYASVVTENADIVAAAPAIRLDAATAQGVPSLIPFLFITVACGAVSGFHALVASGTTSKQIASMRDATLVGYGGMLAESALAVVVIIACTAGIGLGHTLEGRSEASGHITAWTLEPQGTLQVGRAAWDECYDEPFPKVNLAVQVATFIEGCSNFLEGIGIPPTLAHSLIAVLVACFAATTIDTATRLFRYIVQELGVSLRVPTMENRYVATLLAVASAACLALMRPPLPDGSLGPYGTGGMMFWPLFGAGNQLLAGMTLLVVLVTLMRSGSRWRTVALTIALPAMAMIVVPVWAMAIQVNAWYTKGHYLLMTFGIVLMAFALLLVVVAVRAMMRRRGERRIR